MEEKNQQEITQVEITPEEIAHTSLEPPKKKPWLIIGLMALIILFFGTTVFFAHQSFQMVRQKAIQAQPTISPNTPILITTTPTTESTANPPMVQANSFNYKNFTIGYPEDWVLLDMSTNEDFPIKERLSSPNLNFIKVIGLNKIGVYLIVTIEEESEAGASGIFIDDESYNEYISDKDRVVIGSSTFYLSRNHHSISSLLESHGGPYTWSSLSEYLPSMNTQSGKTFRGHEDVIKRNGYAYTFIIVSEQGGQTPPELQSEIITILQSIVW
jgi:hypothetical protein